MFELELILTAALQHIIQELNGINWFFFLININFIDFKFTQL